ncbi:putative reverse transcriptase domain-containing protein [Tanacetum coccineum]|uniref:Reverse transcriptase domain-containing protein n=1 Tax=Tanacetum coccineum TaxID=301880 RepID=A0ABQ5F6V9_9ASTR
MRRMQTSRASDADYYASALMHYEVETETTFKLRHCWEILKDSPKWQQSELPKFASKSRGGSKRYNSSGSNSFNTESGKASINLNTNVGDDDDEDEPYDHLTGDARLAMEELKAEIKAKYDLLY